MYTNVHSLKLEPIPDLCTYRLAHGYEHLDSERVHHRDAPADTTLSLSADSPEPFPGTPAAAYTGCSQRPEEENAPAELMPNGS